MQPLDWLPRTVVGVSLEKVFSLWNYLPTPTFLSISNRYNLFACQIWGVVRNKTSTRFLSRKLSRNCRCFAVILYQYSLYVGNRSWKGRTHVYSDRSNFSLPPETHRHPWPVISLAIATALLTRPIRLFVRRRLLATWVLTSCERPPICLGSPRLCPPGACVRRRRFTTISNPTTRTTMRML